MDTSKFRLYAIRWIGALLPIAMLGCSEGQGDIPSESMGQEHMEKAIAANRVLAGNAKIDSFTKTNGLKQMENGVELYVLEYQMEVSYPKGIMPECVDKSHYNGKCFDAQLNGVQPKKVGAREIEKGRMLFEKAEKGWRVKGVM